MAEQYALLRRKAGDAGAIVSFVGLVREIHQPASPGAEAGERRIRSLTLEHYPGMAEQCLADLSGQAANRWALRAIRIIHRVGELAPGEQIVFVGTASNHRQAAFDAAQFIMDYLKSKAPLWKQQRYRDGTCHWVDSRDSDLAALDRWQ